MSVTTNTVPTDRRAALKARHRLAILDAADALIRERGEPRFSVDELAERADVARRTVFNHFASLDAVVMTACSRVLTAAVDEFWAATAVPADGQGSRSAVFAQFADALRGIDLPSVISYLHRVLSAGEEDPRSHHLIQNVFTLTTQEVAAETARRSVEMDEIDAEVLVGSLMNGLAVVAGHWIRLTGATVDAETRALWNELLEKLIGSVRAGYAPPG
ncbi:MAG: TetR family transcriptional regulator [Glaciihabitans sp.]|nr:TetR family transcriptional regulator [Glaciihabitans sp.]